MAQRSVTIVTLALLMTCAGQTRPDDQSATPVQTDAVTGQAVNLLDHPVAEAVAWGVADQERFGPTRSDADGLFFEDAEDAAHQVDPVRIAGLPETRADEWERPADWGRAAGARRAKGREAGPVPVRGNRNP
jgi:hypothetical protein